jgi:dihydroflavonol-4-reductase
VAAAVLVTGGSGFVGGAIVARLLEAGREVRALARSEAAAGVLREIGAEPVAGDVLDRGSLAEAIRGCEVVYHAAGANAFCLRDPSPLFRVNVDGSRNVLSAAAAAGVRRLVYTSSAATLGEEQGSVGDEESEHRGWFLSAYECSKYDAERVSLDAAARGAVEVVCVNPASVQGPGRTRGTGRLVVDYLNGELNAVVDTRISLVDVDDCAEGHVLAEAHGSPGERYVLCGATLTLDEAIELVGRVAGVPGSPRTLPAPLALGAAYAVEAFARIRRRPAPVCREMVRTMLHGHRYDGAKAARELGLRYTPVEETIRRTVRWYVDQGLVTRPLPGLAIEAS